MSDTAKKGFVLHSRYYYSRLSGENQSLYRMIYNGWVAGGNKVDIIIPGNDFDAYRGLSLHNLVEYIILDNPHLFHLETSQFNYSRRGLSVTISADPVYSKPEYDEVYEHLVQRVSHILSHRMLSGSFIDKITYFHDYLAQEITYDRGLPSTKSQREVHTIVGALLNNACVCDGYARGLRLLCDMSHISCIIVTGIGKTSDGSERHAWNIVKFQGKKYHIDTTWDSNISVNDKIPSIYFLRDDKTFARDHVWDRKFYPNCESDYTRNEPKVKSRDELNSLFESAIIDKRESIIFYGETLNWTLEQFGDYLAEAINKATRGIPIRITYSYSKQDAQPYYQVYLNYKGKYI